ncbi:hypothetical protein HO173_003344 [Letharia columbiana]|uniref:Uncharacterized protein n=1 Tax=Letharia columbiana TaxID=112416 RepID=A0A8H6G1Q9_9LECA|nr:uncharacterized protein HO173_003344 [Letharia columbiana]KAF6238837.1 hypothetical protein HO173_003344 [Letharia columbiana]
MNLSESTSDVYLYGYEAIDERYPKHSSDASFAHANSQYPSVVIETSYSQHQKELTRLADEYVSGSDGNIAMVLGLDIEYGVGSKKASLFIWRSRLVSVPEKEEAVLLETFSVREVDVFRADDGTTVPGQGLSLQLYDFALKSCFANIAQQTQSTTVVRITCAQLCSFLYDAEIRHDIKRAQRGV